MKSILSILFCFIYLLGQCGVWVSEHTCHGKSSYAIYGFDLASACNCKHETDNHKTGCCKHAQKVFIADTDEGKNEIFTVNFLNIFHLLIPFPQPILTPEYQSQALGSQCYYSDHPPKASIPIFIKIRTLLI